MILAGPGIFYTEFSLDSGSNITNFREINMILLPLTMLEGLLNAPQIFESKIDATINELISIVPFSLIEESTYCTKLYSEELFLEIYLCQIKMQ